MRTLSVLIEVHSLVNNVKNVRSLLVAPSGREYYKMEKAMHSLGLEKRPSVGTGLEELRRLYDEEEDRRRSVESKTSGLLAINGILLGIIQLAAEQTSNLSKVVVVVGFTISTLVCLWNLKYRTYWRAIPVKRYLEYTDLRENEAKSKLFIRYFSSVSYNHDLNNVRYRWFRLSFLMTGLAIIGIGLSGIVDYFVLHV